MRTIAVLILNSAVLLDLGTLRAQDLATRTMPPDFSGVYARVNRTPVRQGQAATPPVAGQQQGQVQQLAPPRRSNADGTGGRAPDAPPLTPEYMSKWQAVSKSRMSGSYEHDYTAHCLPPGMPGMMSMPYGMEVVQSKDKIIFFSEMNDALRRVYLDGRKPSQKVLEDPTFAGYSTGHWEGDTLVIDTVAILHTKSFIEGSGEGFSPHSDAMTVRERIRFIEPTLLEDRITVTDPKALTKPWETVKTYRKLLPGSGRDEVRESACPEGLSEVQGIGKIKSLDDVK